MVSKKSKGRVESSQGMEQGAQQRPKRWEENTSEVYGPTLARPTRYAIKTLTDDLTPGTSKNSGGFFEKIEHWSKKTYSGGQRDPSLIYRH